MILDLFLLRVFHAPSYRSFTSNMTTCLTKKILNPKYRTSTLMLVLEIRDCGSLGHCEQDCTAMYCKYFSCFSTIPVCVCVKISRWERRI